jgi:diguanylate cyclase (GGDEF)-like protein
MKLGSLDFSAKGWTRVAVLTALGTLCCIAFALIFDSYSFEEGHWRWGAKPENDIIIPLLIAPPFFFYLLSKLRELAIANDRLLDIATTDGLTSCLTRVAFTTLVDAYLEQIGKKVSSDEGALLVIDVDYFKRVNDSFGHDAGDEALKLIVTSIRSTLRDIDRVGRMGGEEFAVFLPGVSRGRAAAIAERIRRTVTEAEFCPNGARCDLSISVGAVTFQQEASFSNLYKVADLKLYDAKRNGRNRVEIAHIQAGMRFADIQ